MTANYFYILNKKGEAERCNDIRQWARWFAKAPRHVEDTRLPNGLRVSTVFLGLDHNFSGKGPPSLFETMVFNADNAAEEYQERYANLEEAIEGHGRAIEWAKRRNDDLAADHRQR
jgi:hypothetical protein